MPNNPFDFSSMFDQFQKGDPASHAAAAATARLGEIRAAHKGEPPPVRVCSTREELAEWFDNFGIAAGSIARSRKQQEE